jgi:hypothetical protein
MVMMLVSPGPARRKWDLLQVVLLSLLLLWRILADRKFGGGCRRLFAGGATTTLVVRTCAEWLSTSVLRSLLGLVAGDDVSLGDNALRRLSRRRR